MSEAHTNIEAGDDAGEFVRLDDPLIQARQRKWFAEHQDEWENGIPLADVVGDQTQSSD